ncbi:MAG: hypothetical protein WC438_04590 [Candidatus Pacearchaeota archaeon]
MVEIGKRVGALLKETSSAVYFFGYGVYTGEAIPSNEIIYLGRRYNELFPGDKVAKIKLDNGGSIYGCECWWGPEEYIKKFIGDRQVKIVSLQRHRKINLKTLID